MKNMYKFICIYCGKEGTAKRINRRFCNKLCCAKYYSSMRVSDETEKIINTLSPESKRMFYLLRR